MSGQTTCPLFVGIRSENFDTAAELRKLEHGRTDIGAIVTFTGLCRDESGTLSALELEHYPAWPKRKSPASRGRPSNAGR